MSSYNIETLFGYQNFGEAVSVEEDTNSVFENIGDIEEVSTNKISKSNKKSQNDKYHNEEYEEYDDEDNDTYEEQEETGGLFNKLKNKYGAFFE